MSTATARAYRSNFAGRFMPSGIRKSPEIKPFHECRSTYSRKAHCIKDRVLLEPACGIGNFFGLLPESMMDSRLYGVELDSITGRIAKQLYQNASIAVQGFEETHLPTMHTTVREEWEKSMEVHHGETRERLTGSSLKTRIPIGFLPNK